VQLAKAAERQWAFGYKNACQRPAHAYVGVSSFRPNQLASHALCPLFHFAFRLFGGALDASTMRTLQNTGNFLTRDRIASNGEKVCQMISQTVVRRIEAESAFLSPMIQYWADKFNVSKERLSEAVKNVGHSADAVERELKRLA
jgi:hypothetical protein